MRSIVVLLTCLIMLATASAEMPTKKKSIQPPGGIYQPQEIKVAVPIALDVLPAPEPEAIPVIVKQVANEEEETCVSGSCSTGFVSSATCSTGACSQNTGRRLFSRLGRRR